MKITYKDMTIEITTDELLELKEMKKNKSPKLYIPASKKPVDVVDGFPVYDYDYTRYIIYYGPTVSDYVYGEDKDKLVKTAKGMYELENEL